MEVAVDVMASYDSNASLVEMLVLNGHLSHSKSLKKSTTKLKLLFSYLPSPEILPYFPLACMTHFVSLLEIANRFFSNKEAGLQSQGPLGKVKYQSK